MRDDISLAAAGYVEHQSLVLVVSSSHAPATSTVPLAVETDDTSYTVHSQPKVQPVARPAASATAFSATGTVECSSGHVCSIHTYQNGERKCSVCGTFIENQSIGARCNTCNYDVCQQKCASLFSEGSAAAPKKNITASSLSPASLSIPGAPSLPPSVALTLQPGTRVLVQGMINTSWLNGAYGKVVSFNEKNSCYSVLIVAEPLFTQAPLGAAVLV
jgi:hypothetical protein